ncbi:MAG TPA: hypothetical protein VHZ81_02210 [Galbitalea sp.]|nr:hypothetical protein [Galbitalea sp.]
MSATTVFQRSCTTTIHRPTVDVVAEKLARRLLAWTTRRQQSARITHERMALIRDNERVKLWAGSALGH